MPILNEEGYHISILGGSSEVWINLFKKTGFRRHDLSEHNYSVFINFREKTYGYDCVRENSFDNKEQKMWEYSATQLIKRLREYYEVQKTS